MREFETGANRNSKDGKLCYEGFFSPLVLKRRAEYMHKHRVLDDGSLRDPDNWQKGIPVEESMDSMFRHFEDIWLHMRGYGYAATESLQDALCAVMFNCESILLHELTSKCTKEITASGK